MRCFNVWSALFNLYELMDRFVKCSLCSSVDGRIRCIDNVDATRMVCTAELPLDVLVHPDQQDMFVFPGECFMT